VTTASDIDYGPLAMLIGSWAGAKGMDLAPEPDGSEASAYYETLLFEAVGDVGNAERQTLAVLRYHQIVMRQSNDEVFHNESGYWSWDADSATVVQTLTIPRGVCLVAGARIAADASEFEVSAAHDDADWGIVQSPFMRDNAKTLSFRHRIGVSNGVLSYDETTMVDIYGNRFEHTDANELHLA